MAKMVWTARLSSTERQNIDVMFRLNKEFEHNYWIYVTDLVGGFFLEVLQLSIDDSSL